MVSISKAGFYTAIPSMMRFKRFLINLNELNFNRIQNKRNAQSKLLNQHIIILESREINVNSYYGKNIMLLKVLCLRKKYELETQYSLINYKHNY